MVPVPLRLFFFFFNDTATTEIYTLSLHDALPISKRCPTSSSSPRATAACCSRRPTRGPSRSSRWSSCDGWRAPPDRKSTRLNSSHGYISYAVFCLKKKQPYAASRPLHNVLIDRAL